MLFVSIPTKLSPEIENYNIDIDTKEIRTFYELKTFISKYWNINIDSLFFYDTNVNGRIYQNHENIDNIENIYYKKLKNACNVCGSKSTIITGDCSFCLCKYCNLHRLPESHKCVCINKLKKDSFNDNYSRVMNGKCVAAQI